MSFLVELERRKKSLRKTKTTITTIEGKKLLEYNEGNSPIIVDTGERTYGFCEDTKHDVTLAKIEEGLFLGSQDGAHCYEELQRNNITHILNVATGVVNVFAKDFTYKNIELLDLPETDLVAQLPQMFQFINDGLQAGAVLVHCNAGVSRSPAVVIAYLMHKRLLSLGQAFNVVREQRPCVKPNEGFWRQLCNYEQQK